MPRLLELEPTFLIRRIAPGAETWTLTDDPANADGLSFLCPYCFVQNGGAVGTHVVVCWFEDRVPLDVTPSPGRWSPRYPDGVAGRELYDALSLVSRKSNSVRLTGGCRWHGFVTDGNATILGDSGKERRAPRAKLRK